METLTITQIATMLDRPESTLRGYRDRFREFIPTTGRGRGRRHPSEALDVFKFIIELKEGGLLDAQVMERLEEKYTRSLEVADQVRHTLAEQLGEARGHLAVMAHEMAHFQDRLDAVEAMAAQFRREKAQAAAEVDELRRQLQDQAAAGMELRRQVKDQAGDVENKLAAVRQRMEALREEMSRPPWWAFWRKKRPPGCASEDLL